MKFIKWFFTKKFILGYSVLLIMIIGMLISLENQQKWLILTLLPSMSGLTLMMIKEYIKTNGKL